LRAIHTPGHASNHLCYMLEETRMLFTGDHVMQGSTVVINPPDGSMRAYLASLEMLLGEDIAILAPGHGYLIGVPHKEIRRLIAHRLARESKVLAALKRLPDASLDDLVPQVYDDVPARMHKWAARSLTAHLEKLVAERAVRVRGERYTLVQ
jgi:glyoxylase-like metal-dependent hydrolase (beta-lactamase superfamily II)